MERGNRSVTIKIPLDIVEDVLSRLPVKSLLKFRLVSKSWKSLIDSDQFIKIHLKKSSENGILPHHRIILNPVFSGDRVLKICCWASLLAEPVHEPVEFDDGKHISSKVFIVGCCDGLVCLVQESGTFILWNPATRMCLHLPSLYSRKVKEQRFDMYGFGYDASTDDYKVFVVMSPNKRSTFGKLYSLKSHAWTTFKMDFFPKFEVKAGVFVSGRLYWIVDDQNPDIDEGKAMDIYFFDLRDESCGTSVPLYSRYSFLLPTQTLGVIDGCLSVFRDYKICRDKEVWVLKQYGETELSWVKLFTFSGYDHPPLRSLRVRSFCRGPNGEVLLIYDTALTIYSYSAEDNDFRCSAIVNIDKIMGEGIYVESLVSLGPNAGQERF